MRIFSPDRTRLVFSALFAAFTVLHSGAQTLARPRWAGSGLNAEVWWRNAVYYRIAPATFQDSDGDGTGDLRGIAERMSYLQSLSVDAIVLETPFDNAGFDDLLSEASRRHIRLIIALSANGSNSIANQARSWLARGAAGIWLRVPPKADASEAATLVHTLRSLTDTYPGQRVVVEDTSADPAALAAPGAQLVTRSLMAGVGEHTDALSLRVQLAQLSNLPQGSSPVVLLSHEGEQTEEGAIHRSDLQKILAAALFLTRGATAVEAGQEIGRQTATTVGTTETVMQWTPSNVTRPPVAEPAPAPAHPTPRREDEYGPFVPYVVPKKLPATAGAKPDLNAVPGFSSVALPLGGVERSSTHENVASEDADPNSLLNFYRRLSQLHHENATFRLSASLLLNHDAENVLAWLRKTPANARTSSSVLVACNLADVTKTISFTSDFAGSHATGLQPLLTSSPIDAQVVQRTSAVVLVPWSVAVLSFGRY